MLVSLSDASSNLHRRATILDKETEHDQRIQQVIFNAVSANYLNTVSPNISIVQIDYAREHMA